MTHRPYSEQAIYADCQEYARWKEKARDARQKACEAIRSGLKPEFQSSVWRALMPFLLDYFCGNCAYCETKIDAGFWGDVEHYRPKRGVTDTDHPGYYWLAYNPENLMPSCQFCNQGKGKMNKFPVADGVRRRSESENCDEVPLLLNPYVDHPRLHLEYQFDYETGRATGWVEGLTDKGRTSVDIYKLNRDGLRDDRCEAQNDTLVVFEHEFRSGHGSYVDELIRKRKPYMAARLAAIQAWMKWSKDRFDSVDAKIRTTM